MSIRKLLCLGIVAAVVCTSVPTTVLEVQAETEGVVENTGDFQIEEGVLKKYLGAGGDVVIPGSVTSIGDDAFNGCHEMTSVTIPESVTSIGYAAFNSCSGLKSVTIPSSVTSIGDWAFCYCSGLTSVTIPSSVTSIGESVFFDCSRLTNVAIPSSVTSIERDAFEGCGGLTSIIVEEGNPAYDSRNNCNAIIAKEGNVLVRGCENTIIPEDVENIGYKAFNGCSGLTSVAIPGNVTSIDSFAFEGCSALASVAIPGSVTSISYGAFSGCGGLTSITVEEGNQVYDSRNNCNAIIAREGNVLVRGCENTIIPEGVTSIGYAAFSGCHGLTSMAIPGSVTSIGDDAFEDCSALTSVVIPGSVTSIGRDAFSNCRNLASVAIPGSVTSIGDDAFSGCSALVNVTIPGSVTSIGYNAFSGCSALVSVTIPGSVTSIGEYAFGDCISLANVAIPGSVTSIGRGAFSNCRNLASVTIPGSVTNIGEYAFSNCISLASVAIPESVKNIGDFAFGYVWNEDYENEKIPDFTIYSVSGSEAERYAKENGFTFCLRETDIAGAVVTLSVNSYVYDGTAKTPSTTVVLAGRTLILDTDYTVTYSNNINLGIAEVTVAGKGAYTGSAAVPFTIVEAGGTGSGTIDSTDIAEAVLTLSAASYTYDGTAKTPSITVVLGDRTLVLDTDYTVAYSNNINAGTAEATVTGIGSYTGSKTATFTIGKADMAGAAVTLSATSYPYDGTAKAPSVTVVLDGRTLVPTTDYTVSYGNNINPGTAAVTVTGTGNYTGSKTAAFTIEQAKAPELDSEITCEKTVYKVAYGQKPFKINASSKSKMTFTSSRPKVVAVDQNTGMATIKNTGTATIAIKAGTAEKKVTVKVSPKQPSVKSVKAQKGRKLAVKWKKDKMASGYQVQVSTNKKFKKNVKSKKLSKTSYTFTKLKTGKKYHVRIRSYEKSGKETLYSPWSKVKASGKIKQ